MGKTKWFVIKLTLAYYISLYQVQAKKCLLSTQAFDTNVSLGEIVCKIISDGIGKSTNVENAHAF